MTTAGDAAKVWGIGVPGSIGPDELAELAGLAENLGYASFWFNCITPDDPASLLAAAVAATRRIDIGIGVVPLASYPPRALAVRLAEQGLDDERMVLGVGSGAGAAQPLRLVADGLAVLRKALPRSRFAVGGRGPRMVHLAAREADALVLSMPSAQEIERIAGQLVDPAFACYKYHRVAIGPGGADRLAEEMIGNGAWPAAGPGPRGPELLGTQATSATDAAGQVGADLATGPPAWHQVLRPLPAVAGDQGELREMVTSLRPPAKP